MASLPLCSSTTTSTAISSRFQLSPRPIFLAKPPQVSTQSPPRHRSTVSCSAENGDRVDRRNLLVGMGGLYGAANLISADPSQATPITSPDLFKCTLGTNLNTKEPLDVNCCPPTPPEKIIYYKLPRFGKPRVRPAAHLVSKVYADVDYLFDPHNNISQTGYVFL